MPVSKGVSAQTQFSHRCSIYGLAHGKGCVSLLYRPRLVAVPLAGPWSNADTKVQLEFLLFHRGQNKSSWPDTGGPCGAGAGLEVSVRDIAASHS